jgi:hypothetical protein
MQLRTRLVIEMLFADQACITSGPMPFRVIHVVIMTASCIRIVIDVADMQVSTASFLSESYVRRIFGQLIVQRSHSYPIIREREGVLLLCSNTILFIGFFSSEKRIIRSA